MTDAIINSVPYVIWTLVAAGFVGVAATIYTVIQLTIAHRALMKSYATILSRRAQAEAPCQPELP